MPLNNNNNNNNNEIHTKMKQQQQKSPDVEMKQIKKKSMVWIRCESSNQSYIWNEKCVKKRRDMHIETPKKATTQNERKIKRVEMLLVSRMLIILYAIAWRDHWNYEKPTIDQRKSVEENAYKKEEYKKKNHHHHHQQGMRRRTKNNCRHQMVI